MSNEHLDPALIEQGKEVTHKCCTCGIIMCGTWKRGHQRILEGDTQRFCETCWHRLFPQKTPSTKGT